MNKKGAIQTGWVIFWAFILIAGTIGTVVVGSKNGWFTPVQATGAVIGQNPNVPTTPEGGTSGLTGTTLRFTEYNALQTGTTAPATVYYSINGAPYTQLTTATLTASAGDRISFWAKNGTDYHDSTNILVNGQVVDSTTNQFVVPQASSAQVSIPMYDNDSSGSFTMFDTNGVALSNGASGGVHNLTVGSAGAPYNLALRFDSIERTSTNDMRCILETNTTNIQKMVLTGLTGATQVANAGKPTFYSPMVNSQVWVFDVPAIQGAVSPSGVLQIQSASGKTAGHTTKIKLACYSKEKFLDTSNPNGGINYDIQDYNGNQIGRESHVFQTVFQ